MKLGKNIAVYWQSWSSQWVSSSNELDLSKLDPRVNIVNLAFADPRGMYIKGSKSFSNTGLDFSMDFEVVAGAIKILKDRDVCVMLAVGGASYSFNVKSSVQNVVDLAVDLGVNGIDIDWEPADGAVKDSEFTTLIQQYRKASPSHFKISAACFSTGAYGKNGDQFQGMNIKGLVEAGSSLDWLNIMAYDAGPPPPNGAFDPIGSLLAYRIYYPGPLLLGFEPGQMGWGGHFLKAKEVSDNVKYVSEENPLNGIFIWSYQKDTTGSPSVLEIIDAAAKQFGKEQGTITQPSLPTLPSETEVNHFSLPVTIGVKCTKCGTEITLSVK